MSAESPQNRLIVNISLSALGLVAAPWRRILRRQVTRFCSGGWRRRMQLADIRLPDDYNGLPFML